MGKKYIIILFWLFSLPLIGQDITPHGLFHKDSVKIGEPLPYSLWIRYPKDKDVAFPDSLFDFSPFELDKRVYFTTKSDSLQSLDSAVYYFSTFEVDTVQYLSLPIFIINEYDSTILTTGIDSIILDQVVTEIPDSVAVLLNTEYQQVHLAFNYPYFTIGLIIVLVLMLVIFLVFGKKIGKSIKIYRITKRHKKFVKLFETQLQDQPISVEQTLSIWKRYMEKLLSQPYSKLTTKEIIALSHENSLQEPLHTIDRQIYAGDHSKEISVALRSLLAYGVDQYHTKIKEIKHGK